jgi:hypothetical protein
MTYTVTSGLLVFAAEGSTVTDADCEGCNIPALVEGGHLTVQSAVPSNEPVSPEEGA